MFTTPRLERSDDLRRGLTKLGLGDHEALTPQGLLTAKAERRLTANELQSLIRALEVASFERRRLERLGHCRELAEEINRQLGLAPEQRSVTPQSLPYAWQHRVSVLTHGFSLPRPWRPLAQDHAVGFRWPDVRPLLDLDDDVAAADFVRERNLRLEAFSRACIEVDGELLPVCHGRAESSLVVGFGVVPEALDALLKAFARKSGLLKVKFC